MAPLESLRVLDLTTGVAGAMATMLLSDFGADTVKVVPDDHNPRDPYAPGFTCWDRNKSLLRGDLQDAEFAASARQLIGLADVVVLDQSADELAQLALQPTALSDLNPRLITCWLPFYGEQGDWSRLPSDENVRNAITAIADMQHSHEDRPVVLVMPQVSYAHAVIAADAVLAAVYKRITAGTAETVTVSGLHAFASVQTAGAIAAPGAMRPGPNPLGSFPHYRLYRSKDDRWLFLGSLTLPFFLQALEVLELGDVMADSDIAGDFANLFIPAVGERVALRIGERMAEETCDYWEAKFAEAGVPVGPVGTREDWFDSEPVSANQMAWKSPHDDLRMPGVSAVLSRTPGAVTGPATESSLDVVRERWSRTIETTRPIPSGDSGLPLAGVTVLDLGMFIAGTFAPTILANLGADVIKVEPTDGDPFRTYGLIFAGYNRGKRSLAIDLKSEEGRKTFEGLVRKSDIVLDNFRGGVAERLGIGASALAAINPRIITCSVTGFGSRSERAREPGFDPIMQARSGMMFAQGGGEEPVFHQMPINDAASGMVAALGILVALNEREESGLGQHVETSLAAQSVLFQSGELTRFPGAQPPSIGGRDFMGSSEVGYVLPCTDGWIALAAGTPKATLLESLDVRDSTASWGEGAEACHSFGRDEALARLSANGVTAAPALSLGELLQHPWHRENGVFVEYDDPSYGHITAIRGYAKFGAAECGFSRRTPRCGEHSREVLSQFGVGVDDIDRLIEQGVVAARELPQ